MKNVESMSLDELVEESTRLRNEISASAERLRMVCSALYVTVRRGPRKTQTPVYLSMATAGRRFAGAVVQGVKRAAALDRSLAASNRVAEEERQRDEARKKADWEVVDRQRRSAKRRQRRDPLGIFGNSDMDALYGDSLREPPAVPVQVDEGEDE